MVNVKQAVTVHLFIQAWFKKFGLDMPKWDPKVSPSVPNSVNPLSAPGSGKPGDPSPPSMSHSNKPGPVIKARLHTLIRSCRIHFLRARQFFLIRLTVSRSWEIEVAIIPLRGMPWFLRKVPLLNHLTSFF